MRNLNTKSFWNQKIEKGGNELIRSPIYLDKNNIVASHFRNSDGRFLDVGVGYGVLENLLNVSAPRLKIFGIDISTVAINKINKSVKGRFVVASTLKIPFKNKFFDYVAALDVLEHFRENELKNVLNEVKRVLKNNGLFIISIPLNESVDEKRSNRHLITFTKLSVIKILTKSGFEIEKIKSLYAFRNYYFFKTLIAKIFRLKQPNLLIIFSRKK